MGQQLDGREFILPLPRKKTELSPTLNHQTLSVS